ncbi:hypothetical protein [Endozoicomonas lisbonensis]|uniref:Uncharacterized protein n=1 Tax=Endozoicomonas lisbonensis TaxID=3120522 RepID=A0ABV2SIC6_9GAMM
MLSLEEVLEARRDLWELDCLDPGLDKVAPKRLLFELCRSGEVYYLKRTFDEKIVHVHVWQVFIFVVLVSRPTQVFCVPLYNRSTTEEINFWNFPPTFELAHTSITRTSQVYYAGELVLEKDSLFGWDNHSGHYKPGTFMHRENFLPPVKHLLPVSKYKLGAGAEGAYLFEHGIKNYDPYA